jgi:hypothetical protein
MYEKKCLARDEEKCRKDKKQNKKERGFKTYSSKKTFQTKSGS